MVAVKTSGKLSQNFAKIISRLRKDFLVRSQSYCLRKKGLSVVIFQESAACKACVLQRNLIQKNRLEQRAQKVCAQAELPTEWRSHRLWLASHFNQRSEITNRTQRHNRNR